MVVLGWGGGVYTKVNLSGGGGGLLILQHLCSCPLTFIRDLNSTLIYAHPSRDEKLYCCVYKSVNVIVSQKVPLTHIKDLCIHLFFK